MSHKYTNSLNNETSPYLLQHAHNPVNWNPWNTEVLAQAKKENKLIVISVGYSACHWCHIMEEESFEDEEVAKVMNDNFIAIKVDREERPDIDQVYMSAVQLMTGRGGWPLNVIALPDGRPVWGGTYFKKNEWISALNQLQRQYEEHPEKFIDYANRLEQGIISSELVKSNPNVIEFKTSDLVTIVNHWKKSFDHKYGGAKRAPKFMLPNNYAFLLKYGYLQQDKELLDYVDLTLKKIAYGGVFDHIDGGFSRYSTDIRWHIPHFEKMLYDNGQLVSLYSQAYKLTKKELYKSTVEKTLSFIEQELYHTNGYFYSSLDADSYTDENEKEEGAFYVWTKNELKTELKDHYKLFAAYYSVNEYGYWEKNNYVLTRKDDDEKIAKKFNLTTKELQSTLSSCISQLHQIREKRKKPALDNKTLTSWNALMLIGYLDAYEAFGKKHYLDVALKNANFITNKQLKEDGGLFHNFKKGKSTINGYLEDYANVIEAFIKLYENTLDSKWLYQARDLTDYCFDHFYSESNNLFYFTSNKDEKLVVRNIEFRDNVIPASNSIMAKNIYMLGIHFNNKKYTNTAKKMLHNILPEINNYGAGYSNWLDLHLNISAKFKEVVITGNNAIAQIKLLKQHYLPNTLFSGYDLNLNNTLSTKKLPLLAERIIKGETNFYICENSVCQLPTQDFNKALTLLKN